MSLCSDILPAVLTGKNTTIQTDVVESDIPLLLSKIAMKKLKMKIYLDKDQCEIFSKEVELMTTRSGYYGLNLVSKNQDDEDNAWVLAVDFASLPNEFMGDEMIEVKRVLNIIDLTTAAQSPWQNVICQESPTSRYNADEEEG